MYKRILDYINKHKYIKIVICIFILLGYTFILLFFYDKYISHESVEYREVVHFIEKEDEHTDFDKWVDTANSYRTFSNIDFDIFKMSFKENENNVYSPLSVKKSFNILRKFTSDEITDRISNLGLNSNLSFPNDTNKVSQTGIFLKKVVDEVDWNTRIALDYCNSYSLKILDSITPKSINDWAYNTSYGKIDKLFNEDEDLSEYVFIISNITMIDMNWVHRIERGMILDSSHENFSCETISFDLSGYEKLFFDNRKYVSGLSFAAAANKYDIVNDLGYDTIKNTVYEEYTNWFSNNADEHTQKPDEYIEQYMKEIDSNFHSYDSSTDFDYYVDDDVKVFCKSLSNYDSLDMQYIGIMPINESLSDYISSFDANTLEYYLSNLNGTSYYDFEDGYCTKVHGCVPAFDYSSSIDLKDILSNYGLSDLFDPNKKCFTVLTDKIPISLDKCINKTNITFSNDGIEAISTTTISGLGQGGPDFDYIYDVPIIDIDLTFDKPFMYIIMDKQSNEIFYIGAVYNPLEYIQFEGGEA